MKTIVITGSARGLGFAMAEDFRKADCNVVLSDLKEGNSLVNQDIKLSERTKKVYNILGDKPETVAKFFVDNILTNKKNGVKINWLTNGKAFYRFLTAGFNKRNFFDADGEIKQLPGK